MIYSAVEMKRIGVDPGSWNWFNKDYNRYQVIDPAPVSYELKQFRRVNLKRFMVFLLAFCSLVALDTFTSTTAHQNPLVSSAVILPLVCIALMCMSAKKPVKVIGFILGSIIPLSAFLLLASGVLLLALLLLVGTGVIFGVAKLFARSFYFDGRMVERPTRLTGAELWSNPERRVYGNPGGVASAAPKFGKEAVEAGVEGENRTASLLWLLLKIPGVTVFHGLKFPNSKKADVDHAVLHGSNLYLIDSKQYRWGEYEWSIHPKYGEQISRTDGYGRPKDNHMGAAAEGYRRMLGPYVNVITVIIVHGKNIRIGANRWSPSGVGLFTPEEAMLFMGSTISHDVSTWRDNMGARAVLLRNMKA